MSPLQNLPHSLKRTTMIVCSASLFLSAITHSVATASPLAWDPDPTPGVQGGPGTWNINSTNFTGDNGATNETWPNDTVTVAEFGATGGSVNLTGRLIGGGIDVTVPGYTFNQDNNQNDKLELYGDFTGGASVRVSNKVKTYDVSLLNKGVHFFGGTTVDADFNFTMVNLFSSPVLGAQGSGTVVNYSGNRFANGGQSKAGMVIQGGAKIVITENAFLEHILADSYFTRQEWVWGDGTGTLELAEGFKADVSGGITVAPDGTPILNDIIQSGLGSIRLSDTEIITHHTQNLPVGQRPDGVGGFQTNGHFVFEDAGESTWTTRTNPQHYIGAVWIRTDFTVNTETDLTHSGVSEFSSHFGQYWASNGFQTVNPQFQTVPEVDITVTKTGPANLILAGEIAFVPLTTMNVLGGGVIFQTDPAAGLRQYPTDASVEGGPNLMLNLGAPGVDGRGTRVRFEASLSRIHSLSSTQGRVEVLGEVQMTTYSSNSQANLPNNVPPPPSATIPTTLNFHLDTTHGWLNVSGDAALGGELLFTREPGFEPPIGTTFDVFFAGSFSAGPNNSRAEFESVQDRSDLGLEVEYLSDRIRVTTTRGASTTAMIIDEDWTDGAFDAPGWHQINSKADFRATSIPEAPFALTQRLADPGFVWPVYELDVPGFYVADDNVLVIKMTTFSDVAYNSQELAKPEVACLNNNYLADFGHDHATELSRKYYRNDDRFHMNPSVENDDNKQFQGIHHSGGSTASKLGKAEQSLNLFRPTVTGANSEGFGEIGRAETNHTRFLEHFNNILISLPREFFGNKSPVFSTGNDQSTGQIGMSKAHVGVTKRTDANLDYATDALDFIYWNSYRGSPTSTNLQWGDFDNDGDTDGDDLTLWTTWRGQQHDPDFNEPQTKYPVASLPGSGTPPVFTYDADTGILTMQTNGTAVSAWAVEVPHVGTGTAFGSGDWWHAHVANKQQAADSSLAGLSGTVAIVTFPTGLGAGSFGTVTFGYAGGGGGETTVQITETVAPFETWADTNGLTGVMRLPESSPLGDGVSNLEKYGYGLPVSATGSELPSGEIVEDSGNDYLTIEFTRPTGQTDVTTIGQFSQNLDTWSSLPADVTVTIQDNGNGTETVTVRTTQQVETLTPGFLRVMFSQ